MAIITAALPNQADMASIAKKNHQVGEPLGRAPSALLQEQLVRSDKGECG